MKPEDVDKLTDDQAEAIYTLKQRQKWIKTIREQLKQEKE